MTLLASMLLSVAAMAADPPVRDPGSQGAITVQIKSGQPIVFTPDRLGKLVRAKVEAGKPDQRHVYEGVLLGDVLHAAGVAWGAKCSLWLDCYVVVEGADEYRAVFSIPEIDPGLAHKTVLIADHCDGKPLSKEVGPLQIVEQDAKQHGRWVRQFTAVTVRMAAP